MQRAFELRERSPAARLLTVAAAVLFAGTCLVPAAPAQEAAERTGVDVRGEVFVGSEAEQYLRLLQITGEAAPYPWSVRGFSMAELDGLAAELGTGHPWAARYTLAPDSGSGAFTWHWVRPNVRTVYNSAFPYGSNDGALWAGRGLTSAVQVGFALRAGPLSLTVAPVAFHAANQAFALEPNGRDDGSRFADPRFPTAIDLPQRFGDGAYARLDPGESTLRLDALGVALGVSSASQAWGPAREYPLILGNNAGGFAHAFVGTAHPLNLWIGRVHGRMVWGRLDQSAHSSVEGRRSRRFMSGLVGTFTPRGAPGLELGAARFFHTPWPQDGLGVSHFAKPLEGLLKTGLEGKGTGYDAYSDEDNQLGSVFFRWALPRGGFELYGEYAREDHNWDLRDFLLEPDHISAYTLGFQKAWQSEPSRIWALRGELLNARISHLARVRHQGPLYVHNFTRQGHTLRGQILGAPAAYTGGGSVIAVDHYRPGGRWSAVWERTLRGERSGVGGASRLNDVQHALGVEALLSRGAWELTSSLRGVYEFNRRPGEDAFNLNLALGAKYAM